MALTIDPKSKLYNNSSLYSLKSTAFDHVNYRSGSDPPNLTLNADTPKGVLGGMLAKMDYSTPANLVVDICTDAASAQEYPIGWFNLLSEGNAFENAPASASGKVAIYKGCRADFFLYVFETHGSTSPYTAKVLSSVYQVGKLVYAGPYGLATNTAPSGPNLIVPVAIITKIPTSSDLEMGIISLI